MRTHLWRRLGQSVITLLGVITLVYVIQRSTSTPLFVPAQYLSFLTDVLRLEFGRSLAMNEPVLGIVASRVPDTLALVGGSLLVAGVIGVPIGAALAVWRDHWIARPLSWLVLVAQSMPIFWSGILLVMVFVVKLEWLSLSSKGGISQLAMPSIALGLMGMASVARVTRDILIEKRSKEYVHAASVHAASVGGISTGRLWWRHVAGNASSSVITGWGLQLSLLFAGLVVIESLFSWPGLGQLAVRAVMQRDYPMVRGLVLLAAMVAIIVHLVVDLLQRAVDPRIPAEDGVTASTGVDTLASRHPSRRPVLALAGLMLTAIVLVAILAPFIAPFDPIAQNLMGRLKPPGTTAGELHYLLGSDELGRDLFSRVIWGARVSLLVALVSVALSAVVGIVLGALAAYLRGIVAMVIMRLVDIFTSIPAILLALFALGVMGPSLGNLILVLVLVLWPRYVRVVYAKTLWLSRRPAVSPSAPTQASTTRVHGRVLPKILGAVLVAAMVDLGLVVLFESSLSFLGLGVSPPMPSWGAMLGESRNYMESAWWLVVFPGLSLFVLVFFANMLGAALRDPLKR